MIYEPLLLLRLVICFHGLFLEEANFNCPLILLMSFYVALKVQIYDFEDLELI